MDANSSLLKTVYENDAKQWHTFHTAISHVNRNDVFYTLNFVILLLVLRFVLSGCNHPRIRNFPSLFTWIFSKYHIGNEKKRSKLAESLWYLISHIFSISICLKLLLDDYGTPANPGWFGNLLDDWNGVWYFMNDPKNPIKGFYKWPHLPLNIQTRLFLLFSIAIWIACNFYIHFETRRSDMNVMRLHHITTTVLMIVAYVVIFLHDISDVFLYFTKITDYIDSIPKTVSGVFFIIYTLSHLITRFVLMSCYIIYPIFVNMDVSKLSNGKIKHIWQMPGGVFCLASIGLLTLMNSYWFSLIISLLFKFLKDANQLKDDREHDDD
ncbi:bifunctional TRAM-LAG1-CLN8 homology domain/Sphingosine N-acyltransferase Lag1-Lac1-like [Babesia duncani]|uniref:Bifunctional TRAM-LAG1-CLN8 homology domain/Sphingosine N-acyltransferase Lag1-Lac1-like n=1 Tax=Babesia duncani TaxID=323732 RepID=A0AAD9PKP4_9APIC|nr:bifunctional TRAM-LAG1-CLN8 homology domain/Sphingosine N-acyltransferase Lag1-Lac1-like [Babesia duncani]